MQQNKQARQKSTKNITINKNNKHCEMKWEKQKYVQTPTNATEQITKTKMQKTMKQEMTKGDEMRKTKMTRKQAKAICPKTKNATNKQPRLKCNKQSNNKRR